MRNLLHKLQPNVCCKKIAEAEAVVQPNVSTGVLACREVLCKKIAEAEAVLACGEVL
jgi:hypothetical protein